MHDFSQIRLTKWELSKKYLKLNFLNHHIPQLSLNYSSRCNLEIKIFSYKYNQVYAPGVKNNKVRNIPAFSLYLQKIDFPRITTVTHATNDQFSKCVCIRPLEITSGLERNHWNRIGDSHYVVLLQRLFSHSQLETTRSSTYGNISI